MVSGDNVHRSEVEQRICRLAMEFGMWLTMDFGVTDCGIRDLADNGI
jgi:hypothetical protein